jgi:hypothetical protein
MDGSRLTVTSPLLQRLYAYWLARRDAGCAPTRADIDPVDLGFILGHLLLVEVASWMPLRFRIRLHGTHLAARAGYDLTGKMLDELPVADFRTVAERSFSTAVATGEPFHSCRDRLIGDRRHRYETLMLPLFEDDGRTRIRMLLIGLIYL